MSIISDQYLVGQGAGLNGGLVPGQNYTQTATVQRSAEFHNPSNTFVAPNSASSSFREYRATSSTAEPVVGGGAATYQHQTANNSYAFGGPPVGVQNTYGSSVENFASPPHRQGRYRKQVIRLPDQPPRSRQVRRRVPTPEPDTLERIYHQRVAAEIIEEITEIPTTPPPIIQERTVVEPSGPPQVIRRVVRVPPRSTAYGGYQQYSGNAVQYSSPLPQAASYASVQSAQSYYPQYASPAPAYSSYSPYPGPLAANAGGYGSYAAPQQRPVCSACPCSGGVPSALGAGIQGANCFYV